MHSTTATADVQPVLSVPEPQPDTLLLGILRTTILRMEPDLRTVNLWAKANDLADDLEAVLDR